VNKSGVKTALHYALSLTDHGGRPGETLTDAVETLLSLGFDPNAVDQMKRTPLHLAVFSGSPLRCVEALVDAGADATLRDVHGLTPLDVVKRVSERA
jgi:ankyrin repeat protein